MSQEILITGGAGYIGSHMIRKIIKNGYTPIILDNLSTGHAESIPENIKYYNGDIGDIDILQTIFETHNIDAVMHFSAFINVGESVTNPQKYHENNVTKTKILLDTMIKNNIKNFIFSSTAAIYGEPQTEKITEKHSQNPINPYGETKLKIENFLKELDKKNKIKYISLRYFNASGADESGEIGEAHNPETHLIPLVLQNLTGQRENIKIFGTDYPTYDGTCIRDYIHVNDLADAHLKALEKLLAGNNSDFFNLGSENGYSVLEIIQMCEKVSGQKANIVKETRRQGDPPKLVADATKAKEKLGWEPKYDLEKIIETAWHWEQNRKY